MTRRFLNILWSSFILCSLFVGCQGSLDDDRKVDEEQKIENYLNSHKLDYTKENGVYHAIRSKGFGYQVAPNDTIEFLYIGYTLSGLLFDTNILEVALENDLDITTHDFEPLKVVAGQTAFIKGLNLGLTMCRGNQLATILFPSELGFGSQSIGVVPPWTPLAYDIYINYVKNPHIVQEQELIYTFVQENEGFVRDSIGFWLKTLNHIDNKDYPSIGDTIFAKIKGQSLTANLPIPPPTKSIKIALNDDLSPEGLIYSFLRLKENEQGLVVLPSSLAFGFLGNDSIGPYEPMLYHIVTDSIKNKSFIK